MKENEQLSEKLSLEGEKINEILQNNAISTENL